MMNLQRIESIKSEAVFRKQVLLQSYKFLKNGLKPKGDLLTRDGNPPAYQDVADFAVEKHPLLAVVGAVGAGVLIGSLFKGNLKSAIVKNSKELIETHELKSLLKSTITSAIMGYVSGKLVKQSA